MKSLKLVVEFYLAGEVSEQQAVGSRQVNHACTGATRLAGISMRAPTSFLHGCAMDILEAFAVAGTGLITSAYAMRLYADNRSAATSWCPNEVPSCSLGCVRHCSLTKKVWQPSEQGRRKQVISGSQAPNRKHRWTFSFTFRQSPEPSSNYDVEAKHPSRHPKAGANA